VVLDERRLGSTLSKFEDRVLPDTSPLLRLPIHPQLNYSFRFQAGYILTIPMNGVRRRGPSLAHDHPGYA